MEVMILVLSILANAIIVVALGFWHRNLMIQLQTTHAEVWKNLGREDLFGSFWPSSLQLPIWSWSSLFFFITKKYERLGDPAFCRRAGMFRLALLAWLLELGVVCLLNFYWRHHLNGSIVIR
jgi:hypothetical protein